MTDADAASEPKRPTVAASANQCLEPFQQCLLRASSVHPRELSMVEDQVARFSTWTTGIGVFALGRASMDHRLRYAPEVQSVITGLLESLDYRIRTCRSPPFVAVHGFILCRPLDSKTGRVNLMSTQARTSLMPLASPRQRMLRVSQMKRWNGLLEISRLRSVVSTRFQTQFAEPAEKPRFSK